MYNNSRNKEKELFARVASIELRKSGSVGEYCFTHHIPVEEAADIIVNHAFAVADNFIKSLNKRFDKENTEESS